MNVPEEYDDDDKESDKTKHLLLDYDAEVDQDKTSIRKLSDKVMNARSSDPHSPHRSVLGEQQTDKNRNQLIEASLIKVLYVAKSTYVHSPAPYCHGVKKYGKLQTTPTKDVDDPIKKAVNRRIWSAISEGIPRGMQPGTQHDIQWLE